MSWFAKPSILMLFVLAGLTGVVAADLAWRGLRRFPRDPIWAVPGGDAERGRRAILEHGCGGCHVIPGVRLATGRVGPNLTGFRGQLYVAGELANTPVNLTRWIHRPSEINPRTAMPDLPLSEAEARDIVAYLYANP